MTSVHRIDLEVGSKVGSGAQGALFRVEAVRGGGAAGLPSPLIFKEFHAGMQVSGAGLAALARFRDDADAHDREVLDAMTVWPVAVVEDGSHGACGYLMRSIPDGYFQPIETTVGAERIPREIQQLFVVENLARKNFGETPNNVERMALAREMAFVLGFLHKRDFVYGDLSYKNAVFCLRPRPSVILLDCDAVRRVGETSGVAQLNSPGWKPPEGGPQTKQTDRYKLGLFVLRVMTPGVNAQNRDPDKATGHLDAAGLSLLRRALGDEPDRRTTGKEWVQYFNDRITTAGGIRGRTGTAPRPERPSTRRSTFPAWEQARSRTGAGSRTSASVPVPTRRSYVLTSRGVHAVVQSPASARTGGSPSGIVTPSLVRYGGWRTTASNRFFTAGSKSFGTANPPIVTQQSAYVVAFFVVVGLIAGVLAVGFATSNGAKIGAATGIPRTAVTSTTSVSGGGGSNAGQATTSLSRSAQGAVVDAKKFVDAIDQRVVGLYLPPGSYRVLDSSFPWVVQFSSADPDRSSGQPVWTIRNVQQEAGGAFQELAPTTVTAEHLNGLTGDWGSGLDAVVQAVPTIELTGMRLLCDPNGTTCVWQVAADPGPRYFAANGARLTGPPAWVTGT